MTTFIQPDGQQIVQVAIDPAHNVIALPAGAATAANQTTEIGSLATIASNTTGVATATNQTTANNSLATIATNTTGGATAANQAAGNVSLSNIATNTTGIATAANQATEIGSLATIATNTTGVATAANQTTELATLAAINGKFTNVHAAVETTDVHDRGMPWAVGVSHGLIAGCTRVSHVGSQRSTAVGASLWGGSGAYPWIPSARTLEIVSSSANDSAAGTGMRQVYISGLNASYAMVSETVTMNGTTAVALTNTYLRINDAINVSAGSFGTNVGTVTIRDTGGGATRGIISVQPDGGGSGYIDQCAYTVPAGYSLEVQAITMSINRTGAGGVTNYITLRNFIRNNATGAVIRQLELATSSNGPYRHGHENGYPLIALGEKTDVDLIVISQSAAVSCTGAFIGTLVQNSTVLAP